MRTYGLKRNWNAMEENSTKYDGWRSKGGSHSNRTQSKKRLHRAERRRVKQQVKSEEVQDGEPCEG